LKADGFHDFEREEYDSSNIVDYKDNWLEFESAYNRIGRIKLGALFDDDDNYVCQYNP
jgi:hypothetical protein